MASLSRPLTDKQEMVLQYVLAGTEDDYICNRFRIHRSTLFRWKFFIAELNRRQHELWNDVAGELRLAASQPSTPFAASSASSTTTPFAFAPPEP